MKRIALIALFLFGVCIWLGLRWEDTNISRKLPGTWTADWDKNYSWKMGEQPNPSFTQLYKGGAPLGWAVEGTWQVKRGFLVFTLTNSHPENRMSAVETFKVIHVDEHQLELLWVGADKTQLLYKN